MNIPCGVSLYTTKPGCAGVDEPVMNLSSEAPDVLYFFSPIYLLPQPPNCLSCTFTAISCAGVAYSATSQQEADLLAAADSYLCTPPATVFWNTAQTVCTPCAAGGTDICYTTPAGTFPGPNQAQADAHALAYAQQQVAAIVATGICTQLDLCDFATGASLPDASVGVPVAEQIVGLSAFNPKVYSLRSGTLPPGLTMDSHGNITGTPTTAGTYVFNIQVLCG